MPVLTATGAGVRDGRRWLFRDLDVTVDPGDIATIVGPPGSGRTTLLLALADRYRLSAGRLVTDGVIALGHVPAVHQPEPMFTVAEHVRERLHLLGRRRVQPASVLADGGLGLDPAMKGWELSPYQRQLLGLVLARLSSPQLIALDGVDDGLDRSEQAALWRTLTELAASGVAVLVTAREVDPDMPSTVIRLGGDRAEEAPEPVASPPDLARPSDPDGRPAPPPRSTMDDDVKEYVR